MRGKVTYDMINLCSFLVNLIKQKSIYTLIIMFNNKLYQEQIIEINGVIDNASKYFSVKRLHA